MTNIETEMKELGRNTRLILTTLDRWSVPSSMSQTSLQTEEVFTVKEHKYTHTHKHTQTQTHTHTHKPKN